MDAMGASLPLPILAGVIGLGIPLLLTLVHAAGGSRHVPLDEELVRRLLAHEDATATLDLLHVDADGHHALVRTADGRRFVAWSMESSGALRQIRVPIQLDGDALLVRFDDPGWPARRVHLPSEQRAAWLEEAGHAA